MYMCSVSLHVKNRLQEMRIMFIIAKAFVFICVCVCVRVFNMENWCSVNCRNCLVCFVLAGSVSWEATASLLLIVCHLPFQVELTSIQTEWDREIVCAFVYELIL